MARKISNDFIDLGDSGSGGACGQPTARGSFCQRCRQFQVDLTNTSDDLSATDGELKASRQVINLLQRQLELFRAEKESLEQIITGEVKPETSRDNDDTETAGSRQQQSNWLASRLKETDNNQDDDDFRKKLHRLIYDQLYNKEEQLVHMKYKINEVSSELEQLKTRLNFVEKQNDELKSENFVLRENLSLRDKTIVSLSNEVFEQGRVEINGTLKAFKKTNELLSSNVVRLTEKCGDLDRQEKQARSQCHELEAKCCQIQSKLLSLLKEIEQSSKSSSSPSSQGHNSQMIYTESVKSLIKRLLEDKSLDIPLSWKEGNGTRLKQSRRNRIDSGGDGGGSNSTYDCDELGFYFVTLDDQEDKPLSSSLFMDQQHTSRIGEIREVIDLDDAHHDVRRNVLRQASIDATKNDETTWRLKWDNFIKDMDKLDLGRNKEFKNLLRCGVPQEYRCKIWTILTDLRMGQERKECGPDYYLGLLEPSKSSSTSSAKQIELDLLRTLPNNKHFETIDSPGTMRLRRVLTAYSERNPKVGYCQGMNRLAAVALLVVPEEEAFWLLASIIEKIMPEGYYNDLWLAQVDSSVVMNYVSIKMPNLGDHFKHHNIELSLFAWFLTIFVDGTPPAMFLRLWDSFLYEGDKILFRVALALLKIFESQLLKLTNSVAVNNFLRSNVNSPMDIDHFFHVAFEWINPLSGKSLRQKRQQNLEIIKSDMESTGCFHKVMTPVDDDEEDDEELLVDTRDKVVATSATIDTYAKSQQRYVAGDDGTGDNLDKSSIISV